MLVLDEAWRWCVHFSKCHDDNLENFWLNSWLLEYILFSIVLDVDISMFIEISICRYIPTIKTHIDINWEHRIPERCFLKTAFRCFDFQRTTWYMQQIILLYRSYDIFAVELCWIKWRAKFQGEFAQCRLFYLCNSVQLKEYYRQDF